MNKLRIQDLIKFLKIKKIKYKFVGDENTKIDKPSNFFNIKNNSITFYRGDDPSELKKYIKNKIACIILSKSLFSKKLPKSNYIFVTNPDLIFNYLSNLFVAKSNFNIHPTVIIDKNAKIGKNVSIGAYSVIGENVTIDQNVTIGDSVLLKNVHIKTSTKVLSSCVIGDEGIGAVRDENNKLVTMPHFGKVIIDENVIIFNRVTINRGNLEDTFIGKGSIIGSNSFISHNVKIEKNVLLAFAVVVCGSVKINKNSNLWSNVTVKDGVTIGSNATIGMGSIITKNIPSDVIYFDKKIKKKK